MCLALADPRLPARRAQEFLAGTEYVVDSVSRDGAHKTTCVWEYEKRAANGGDFVYFQKIVLGAADGGARAARAAALVGYAHEARDAVPSRALVRG